MATAEPAKIDRARRIIGWEQSRRSWVMGWGFYDAPAYEGELTQLQIADPLLLPPLVRPEKLVPIFPEVVMSCVVRCALLPPAKHHSESGEPLYSREEVYDCLDKLLDAEAYVSGAVCAKFLDISPSSLREYSDKGIIPSVRIGKHRRYQLKKVMLKLEGDHRAGSGRIEALRHLLR
jgi:hypothetical protein